MTERNLAMKRATQMEQEAAEWRRRFDLLLVKAPSLTGIGADPGPQDDPRMAQVRSLMHEYATKERGSFGSSKVKAVKLYREITGAMLRDSVIACEAMMNGNSPSSSSEAPK